jgi:hypothetical protein
MDRFPIVAVAATGALALACSREPPDHFPPIQQAAVNVAAGMGTNGSGGAAGSGGNGGSGGVAGSGGAPAGTGGASFCDQSGTCEECATCAIQTPCFQAWIECQNDLDCSLALGCLQDCYDGCAGNPACYAPCKNECAFTRPGHDEASGMLSCICSNVCPMDCAADFATDCVAQSF